MKHWISWLLLALALPGLAWAETQYVQVDKARLLAKPSSFSKAKAVLAYRAAVTVLGQEGAYAKVTFGQVTGYLPQRSLTERKPAYTSKLSKQYVSSDEVAMATKGFNAQVESDYRKKNPTLAYDDLNRLEKQTACADPANAFRAFRQAGRLGEFQDGGDAR